MTLRDMSFFCGQIFAEHFSRTDPGKHLTDREIMSKGSDTYKNIEGGLISMSSFIGGYRHYMDTKPSSISKLELLMETYE